MRSPGAEGIAEKRGVPAAKELSNERFNEERSMEKPLLVLRGGAPVLSSAPHTTRGPAGAFRSPDGASRDVRQSAPLGKGTIAPLKNEAKGSGAPLPGQRLEPFAAGCRPGHPGSTGCPLFVGR